MATFSNGESGLSVRTKINDVLQHMDGTSGTLVINEAGADVDIRVESDTNTNAIYMDGATGNVGLGTSAPASLLHVNATAGGGAIFSQAGYNYATVSQVLSSADAVFGGGVIASSVAQQVSKTTADAAHYMKAQITEGITFHTNITGSAGTSVSRGTNERMRITAAGDVGIGTSAPAARLDIDAGNMRFADGWGPIWGASPNQPYISGSKASNFLNFGVSGSERMRIDSLGNVGIGTSSPTSRLDVAAISPVIRANATGGGTPTLSLFSSGVADWNLRGGGSLTFFQDTTERMRLNSAGNLGLAVTPSAWEANWRVFEQPNGSLASNAGVTLYLTQNAHYNGTNWIYKTSNQASYYGQALGAHQWFTAPAGTAGNAFTFTQAMGLDANGILTVGNARIQTGSGFAGVDTVGATPLILYTNSTERMRITAAGNVGIGVTLPARPLDVNGTARIADGAALEWGGTSASISGSSSTNTVIFSTASLERMRISAAGDIGIGVTPSGNYTIQGASNFNTGFKGANFGGASIGSSGSGYPLVGYNVRFSGTGDTYTYNASDFANAIAFRSGQFQFFNAASGTAGAALTLTQAMTLDTSGNLGVGTTTPNAASIIDAQSTTKGVRFPNMTTTQKNAMANVAGNVIFDTTLGKLCVNTGSGWQTITSA